MAQQQQQQQHPRVWLDVDIDGARAAHARAVAFVASCSRKYGLSSPVLSELGGSERARIPAFYAADHAWSSRGRLSLEPAPHERLTLELYADAAPNAVKNFVGLIAGDRGLAKGSGKPLAYVGCGFHRATHALIQGGDFAKGNGSGGESIWGGTFKDDKGGLALKFERLGRSGRGVLAMCNSGPNSNGSQFFLTFCATPKLNGKHVVLGQVVDGWEVLDAIEAAVAAPGDAARGSSSSGGVDGAPRVAITIAGCGVCA